MALKLLALPNEILHNIFAEVRNRCLAEVIVS